MFIEQAVAACYEGANSDGFLYRLPDDFPALKGHFEGHPLLPAVCHLSFLSDAACRLLQKQVEVKAVRRAKFINPVLPGMQLEVSLEKRPDGWYFAQLAESDKKKKLSQIILQFGEITQ